VKKLTFLILSLIPFFVSGQITFQKIFTLSDKNFGNTICNVPANRYAIAGQVSIYPGKTRMFVLLVDEAGDTLWTKMLQDTVDVFAIKIILTPDTNLVLMGLRRNTEIIFLKLDLLGNILLSKSIVSSSPYHLGCSQIINATDSGYLILGTIADFQGIGNTILVKTNTLGNVEWTKVFYSGLSGWQLIKKDSFYLLSATSPKSVLLKIDSQGNIIWGHSYDYSMGSIITSIHETNDNGYILGGFIDHYPTMDWLEATLLKVDSVGNNQWSMGYGFPGGSDTKIFDVVPKANGNYVFTFSNLIAFYYGAGLVETDSAGNPLWYRAYETSGDQIKAVRTSDDGFMIASTGLKWAQGYNLLSLILIKTDSTGNSGCYDTTAAMVYHALNPVLDTIMLGDSSVSLASANLFLLQDSLFSIHDFCFSVNTDNESRLLGSQIVLYPNPTNDKLTISNLQSSINQIVIYSMLGEKIFPAVYLQTTNSQLRTEIDISSLTNGIYILQISDGEKTWRGKVIKE